MKRPIAFILLLLLAPTAFAQEGYRGNYDAFKSGVLSSFEDFTHDIRQKWERHALQEGLERGSKPPMDSLPFIPVGRAHSGKQLRVSEIREVVDYTVPLETNTAGSWRDVVSKTAGSQCVSFDFYGQSMSVVIPFALGSVHPSGISEEDVAGFWKTLSRMDFQAVLAESERLRYESGFNDWAILAWVQQLSHAVYSQDLYSECTQVSVYLLNQMGLMSRMARIGNRLTILFAAKQTVYGRKYVVLDTYPFYLADPTLLADEVYTYGNVSVRRAKPLDLRVLKPIRIGEASYKILGKPSRVFGKTISVPVNQSLMVFYSHYPQMEAREYALARSDVRFTDALVASLQPLLEEEKETDAVNRLLCFLQRDFEYKVDAEQFGYEKPFFPEENFVYAFNDCEDRSILLSFLVWNLMNKKMVLLDYGDHLAAAVCLDTRINGDYVTVGKERYYVCDPSCINATVGVSMPQYREKPVTVWVL